MENLLEIRDLGICFGQVAAVKRATFSVGEGQTVVLAGESGSGKTLTALSVTRILPYGARVVFGRIVFGGKELLALEERQMEQIRGRKISYIFQEPSSHLNPVFTIGSQIREVLRLHRGMTEQAASAETLRLLDAVRIRQGRRVSESYPHQLSGGMNQRAFLAMALACGPRLLIADEPTTSLDVTIERQIIDLLLELKRSMAFSLLFITHNLAIARRIADSIVIMHRGEVVETGSSGQIFGSPAHAHTRELIAAYEKIGRI